MTDTAKEAGMRVSDEMVEAMADAIDAARYAHPLHPRTRPHPFSEAHPTDREYAFRLARAALSAARPPVSGGAVEVMKVALTVLCAARGGQSWHENMLKDFDAAIYGLRVALESTAALPHLQAQEWQDGWRFDIENMPTEGRFEALGAQPEVFRHLPNETWVIVPKNGRMFQPYAWRLAPVAEQREVKP